MRIRSQKLTLDKKNNGWGEWSNKVLTDLEDFKQDIKELYEEIGNLKTEIAVVKAKSAILGAIAGIATPIISGLIYLIIKIITWGSS